MPLYVLGLSAFYHESACCLLRDGQLVATAAEERFSRLKHDSRLPVEAFRWCLGKEDITVADLDAVAWYEEPVAKLSRQLFSGSAGTSSPALDPRRPEHAVRDRLGFDGRLLFFPHHLSHAASAFDFSGFEEAAVLVADGVGEWATTSYAHGSRSDRGSRTAQGRPGIEIFEEVSFPHSLGLLYSTLTAYLGFKVNDGEYKVMGLAPYGEPRFIDEICQLIGMGPDGQFKLNLRHFDFIRGRRMFSAELPRLLGRPPRHRGEPLEPFHHDVARSLQLVLEEILLEKTAWLKRRTGARDLVMAGGVALNSVANGRLRREGPFERLFVQPAAGDAGGSLGAAALAHRELTGESVTALRHAFLGPSYSVEEIVLQLAAAGLDFEDYRGRETALIEAAADRLARRQVIGWFNGRMEHGPRALGGRSILANPLDPEARDRVNRRVKHRESFRPFAPSVLAEHAGEHFDFPGTPSLTAPYMLETCQVRSSLDLPAITHVDGSARPQTVDPSTAPRYAALLEAFHRKTGAPLLLNTSFNLRDEPIVCSPGDALFCFGRSGLDALVLEDFILDREAFPKTWEKLLETWERAPRTLGGRRGAIDEELYTFV